MSPLHPSSARLQKHDIGSVALLCMDHRFSSGDGDRKAIRHALGTDDVEFVQIAGGAGCFASIDDAVKAAEHAKVSLDVAVEKHHAKRIFLTTHTECGAYALAGHLFEELEKERDFHVSELSTAREEVCRLYPDLEVLAGFLTVDESDEPIIEMI